MLYKKKILDFGSIINVNNTDESIFRCRRYELYQILKTSNVEIFDGKLEEY